MIIYKIGDWIQHIDKKDPCKIIDIQNGQYIVEGNIRLSFKYVHKYYKLIIIN